jgi:hypothetical protein
MSKGKLEDNITDLSIKEGAETTEYQKFNCDGLEVTVLPPEGDINARVLWKAGDKHGEFDNDFLWSIAWMIANDQMKEKLIPMKTEEKRVFYKTIKLRLKDDMKAGSEVVANVKFTVPLELLVQATKSGFFKLKS